MINGRNFFGQPVKSNLRTYDNIQKIAAGQRDDYTTCQAQLVGSTLYLV